MKIISLYKSALIAALIIVGSVFVSSGTANAIGPVEACIVRIEKIAKPGGDTEFEFTVELEQGGGFDFSLTSPGDPVREIIVFDGDPTTVTEQVPERLGPRKDQVPG